MSLVDTIIAHGKLWFSEDDSRTSVMDPQYLGPNWATGFNGPITTADLDETLKVIDRNFTAIETHRAGTWWMDLIAAGQFNHPALGELLKRRVAGYQQQLAALSPYRPDVAVIVDERSKECIRSDWSVNSWTMVLMRHAMGLCGREVGWYSLTDFVAGVVPECQTYLFANAFCLDDQQCDAILARLRREQARAIWVYAPGYLQPDGPDLAQSARLTGLTMAVRDGAQGSTGEALLAGLEWGAATAVRPRLVIADDSAAVLGRFREDDAVSAARTDQAGYQSTVLADLKLSGEVLQRLLMPD
jgi:hypothetical protein